MENSDSTPLFDHYPQILHLGCGRRKEAGAFGVDVVADSSADIVWNLDETPWPLPDNTFSKIIMIDVLEHLKDAIKIMEEVYRVAKPNAEIIVQAPFASSHHLWTDPTH
ncbi:MAG: methyltransferase domain-containing protein, partial [Candidatus Promineifilaceae bacterium]